MLWRVAFLEAVLLMLRRMRLALFDNYFSWSPRVNHSPLPLRPRTAICGHMREPRNGYSNRLQQGNFTFPP